MIGENELFRTEYYVLTEYRYGLIFIIVNDTMISQSVFYYGDWVKDEMDILQKVIKPGDYVFDVGSNIGTHTLAFSQFVGKSGRVYSFDPCRFFTQALSGSLVVNDIMNVRVYNVAAGSENKPIKIKLPDLSIKQNFGEFRFNKEKTILDSATTFEMKTLEDFEFVPMIRLGDIDVAHVELIKLDIEGLELETLKSSKDFLMNHTPIIFAEYTPTKLKHLLNFLKSLDYNIYNYVSEVFSEDNFMNRKDNVFGANLINRNLLAVHKTKDRFNFDLERL